FLFSSLVISYAVFTARFWGWLLAVAFQGALFFSSFWTLFMVQTEVTYTWQIGMLQATSVLMVLILFIREIRIPFFNPKTRWWKQDKRFLVSLDMVVKNKEHEISGKTYDLARRGVFMISDEPVEMNERFEIRMKAPGEKTEIEGEGKVVWINEGKAELPIGFGINFLFMELPGSRLVRRFVKDPDHTRIK
ncbi:MAG: PilZ domain-containing protein, partial [Proteobacteria bacterium]|nr:PilZ domain-containing protein [Pseudomonadota bacterium]